MCHARRRDRSWLLQAVRFLVRNDFLQHAGPPGDPSTCGPHPVGAGSKPLEWPPQGSEPLPLAALLPPVPVVDDEEEEEGWQEGAGVAAAAQLPAGAVEEGGEGVHGIPDAGIVGVGGSRSAALVAALGGAGGHDSDAEMEEHAEGEGHEEVEEDEGEEGAEDEGEAGLEEEEGEGEEEEEEAIAEEDEGEEEEGQGQGHEEGEEEEEEHEGEAASMHDHEHLGAVHDAEEPEEMHH